ncbi:SagB/ThcOx family dehydrogenase [Streptomyces filamentosus]|uniref:SagB/ThcOx family dehydrogenase n=1 Tax=Streptomyces filamentosus TaxID=67294 RepID=UPI0037D880FB
MPTTAPRPVPPDSGLIDLWSLRQDTLLELPDETVGAPRAGGFPEEEALLSTRWGETRLPITAPVVLLALERLSYGPVSLDNVVAGISAPDGPESPERDALTPLLRSMENVLVRSLAAKDGKLVLSVVPISRYARFRPSVTPADAVLRLSRFAALRTHEDGLCAESPLSGLRVVLHQPRSAWLVSCFARPSTPREAAGRLRMPVDDVRQAMSYLEASGMVVRGVPAEADGSGRYSFAEDEDPALVPWSPHDLMMHARSRQGRHDGPVGATGGLADAPGAEPVVARAHPGPVRVPLPVPELDRVLDRDPPFTVALEARRSVRDYGEHPLDLFQLGELLYRSARVRSMGEPRAEDGGPSLTSRPYPSVGGAYALELYLTVSKCAGLPRGTYHYDPSEHALVLMDMEPDSVDELLAEARTTAGLTAEPHVLVTMTARFRRMTLKYSGLAYSGLLKDVGVLQQTLYLVCTAMGIGPCALAIGDSDLSAHALGLDWRTESAVGEFVLGTLPAEPGADGPLSAAVEVRGHDWHVRCSEQLRRALAHTAE